MELNNICSYVKDKIETAFLDERTYISTENMGSASI